MIFTLSIRRLRKNSFILTKEKLIEPLRIMYRLKYALNILLLLVSLPVYAQTGSPALFKKCPVNTINYEQGLLNNEVTAIITDSLGFTWASTIIGLQRYNGYTLENINPVINGDTIKIKTPVCFFNLNNRRLWISCKKGILEYNPKTNTFKNLTHYFVLA